jgi:hypothetical protein
MHIVHSGSIGLRLENSGSSNTEIEFFSGGANRGAIGYYLGYLEMMTFGAVPISLGTDLTTHLTISATGNIVLGNNATPPEKLVVPTGNILLQSSLKGIMLNAADRPFITRGFDAFTSGNYQGLGRWGLFMEPSRLVLGIPNVAGKRVEIASYEANSTRNTLLTVDETGSVSRPPQGNANLLPICMGNIAVGGGILSGTGNFSVEYSITGTLDITINGHSYNRNQYLAIATTYQEQGNRAYATVVENAGKLRIWRFNDGGTETNQAVGFVVYKLN